MYFLGLDIGSTNTKLCLLNENEQILELLFRETGFSSKKSADELIKEVADKGYDLSDLKIVATGYGRVSFDKADKIVTEITCHAKGSTQLFKENNLIVIDVGGQDTKIISVENGIVRDFIMNDKCSAGTGRFLDVMARTMEMNIENLVETARGGKGITISSLCTVFAESEVISLIGQSEKKENIANALVRSVVTKVVSQLKKMNISGKQICLTGGLCSMSYFVELLSETIGKKVLTCDEAKYAGAIGAALLAKNIH